MLQICFIDLAHRGYNLVLLSKGPELLHQVGVLAAFFQIFGMQRCIPEDSCIILLLERPHHIFIFMIYFIIGSRRFGNWFSYLHKISDFLHLLIRDLLRDGVLRIDVIQQWPDDNALLGL